MASFESLMGKKDNLVRKPTDGTVLLAPHETATIIGKSQLWSTNALVVPTGYEPCGWISEDGLTFASDFEVSDIRAWGSQSYIRRDIQSTDMTLQFSAIETKRRTKELVTGLDLSAVEMSTDGFLSYDIPDRMPTKEWSVLALASDGEGAKRYYMGKFFPRMTVNERDDEAWTDGDDPLMYNVTMGALVDSNAGFVCREFLFGPGALAAAEDMGWEVAS